MCPRPGACDRPTQHLYRVPRHALAEAGGGNLVTLFEETAEPVDPRAVRLVELWQHPALDLHAR